MKDAKKVVAGLVLGLAMWGVPAAAEAASVGREGVTSYDFNQWQGVEVCDTKADGNAVYSDFRRDSGSTNRVKESGGNGQCEDSGTSSSNLVSRFNACNDLNNRPDPCTDPVYRN